MALLGSAEINLRPELGNIFLFIKCTEFLEIVRLVGYPHFLQKLHGIYFLTDLKTTFIKNDGHLLYVLWHTGRL